MSNPAVINALRVIALADADELSPEAWYKSKCRWYSREFHTELQKVVEMPIEVVLGTYYEDLYWNLRNGSNDQIQQLNQIILNTLATDSPTFQQEQDKIEAEDDEWYEQELAAYHAQLEAQDRELAAKKLKAKEPGILIDNPNLSGNTQTTVVNPIDPPVFDENEED
jgi:hypothetical protein